ncbi:GDSL esterase/lipase at3g26430 [Phtheirospermum japonicum]|uniref:GDSL esterase/lipase at3g26430 n=1 Tax=Phtheirospermum japonicum TaxID=374723 RepID=A0A830CGW3_9LAMI|nr:GDSL esterase/lipase at3g26430 [Phtheirospermum japonicum]
MEFKHITLQALVILEILFPTPILCLNNCNFPAIFNFGDSNSDTGGLSAAFGQAPSPNGQTYFHAPAGRFCDGRLVIDLIVNLFSTAERLGLPHLSAFLDSIGSNFSHGANFATAGSTIRPPNTTISQSGVSPISLDVQYVQYSDFMERSQIIRKQGGQSFWIHNTGPAGCLPYVMDRFLVTAAQIDKYGCSSPFNEVSKFFKCGSKKVVNGTKVIVAKSCKDPSVRISWDGTHFTEAANRSIFNHFNISQKMHEKLHVHIFSILLLLCTAESEIQSIRISSDDRPIILFQDFGFDDPGHISISISSISIATTANKSLITPTKLSFMGFFYGPSPARQAIKLALLENTCILGSPFIFPIFTFDERVVSSKTGFRKSVPVTIPDLYHIFFVNCARNSSVSMTVNLETYNVDPENGLPDYLDEHFANLPTTLFVFSLFYSVFLLAWAYACNQNKHFLNKVHILMTILLFLKFLELICHANAQHSIRVKGSSEIWSILWLGFYFARNMLFVFVIMLIRAGWSIFRPCLQNVHRYVICMAITLQITASVCFILIRGFGPTSKRYKEWVITYYAVDFLCCVLMALPVSKFVEHLGGKAKVEGKEAKRMVHKRVFGNFALALYVYVGLTRFVIFVMRTVTSYNFWFLTIVLEMAIELVFYVGVYLMFWPNERYDYVAPENRDEELA